MIIRHFLLWGTLAFLPGCLSTIDSTNLQLPKPVDKDEAYNKAYRDSSASFDVIHHFETKYKVHITQLNPTFREAIAKRYQEVFHEPQPLLTEASEKTGFFVSIYAKTKDLGDISDPRYWNVQLRIGDRYLKPSVIKRLGPKERWQVFFPEINLWSSEYLVLFDQPPPSAEPDSVKYTSELILASPEASVSSRW